MSSSEAGRAATELADLAARLEEQVDLLVDDTDTAGLQTVTAEVLRSIVTAAARLHARFAASDADPLRADVNPTEAVDLACALLRARSLNPFDLALWYSRPV